VGGVANPDVPSPGRAEPRRSPQTIDGRAWRRAAFALFAVAAGTNVPAPLLLIYRDTLHLSPDVLTAVFGVYAAGLVPALFLEFVIILDRLDLDAAQQVADRLRAAVSALHVVDGLQITVSIGLAHHQSEHGPVDLNQLLTRADTALYQAKSSGRDRVQTY